MQLEPYLILMGVLVCGCCVAPRLLRFEVVGLSFVATGFALGFIGKILESGSRADDFVFLIQLTLVPPGLALAGFGRLLGFCPAFPGAEPKPPAEPELPVPPSAWRRRIRLGGLILGAVALTVCLAKIALEIHHLPTWPPRPAR